MSMILDATLDLAFTLHTITMTSYITNLSYKIILFCVFHSEKKISRLKSRKNIFFWKKYVHLMCEEYHKSVLNEKPSSKA